jgi:hypothetical protein
MGELLPTTGALGLGFTNICAEADWLDLQPLRTALTVYKPESDNKDGLICIQELVIVSKTVALGLFTCQK